MIEKHRAAESTVPWSSGSHLLASRRRALIGHHYSRFPVHDGFAVLIGADCRESHPALRVIDLEYLELHCHGVTDADRPREAERLAQVDGSRPGKTLRNRSGYESRREHSMRDASTELRARRDLLIQMHRISVTGCLGEELHFA